MDCDTISPPEKITQWVEHHWDVSRVTHKDISEAETRKIGKAEVAEMVFENIWYVQIQKNRCNVCPIQENNGRNVEHSLRLCLLGTRKARPARRYERAATVFGCLQGAKPRVYERVWENV